MISLFDVYMAEKSDGYYNADRLGLDFFTTPMHTQALACALWKHYLPYIAQYPEITYVEYGPGRLELATAMLGLLHSNHSIKKIILIERSAALRAWQHTYIQEHWPIEWQERVEIAAQLTDILDQVLCIMHEVLDALPVRLVQYYHKKWYSMGVDTSVNPHALRRLDICARPSSPWADAEYTELSRYEVYPHMESWLLDIIQRMHKACLIFVDYGDDASTIYHPDRPEGTLRGFYKHKVVPWHTEHADITVDVNWSYVAALLKPYVDVIKLDYQAEIMARSLEYIVAEGMDTMDLQMYFDPLALGRRMRVLTVTR